MQIRDALKPTRVTRHGGSVNFGETRVALFHAVNYACECKKNRSLLRSAIDRSAGYMMFDAIPTKRIVQPALLKEGRVSVARHIEGVTYSSTTNKRATRSLIEQINRLQFSLYYRV